MGKAGRRIVAVAVMMIATSLPAVSLAVAETQTENIVAEQRTSLSLRIAPEAAQRLLPAGWEPGAGPNAPNLSLIFMDRKLALTPDGALLGAGVNRLLVMSMGARNTETGETRSMIVGGYSADPAGSPGAYNVYGKGVVTLVRTEHVSDKELIEERWSVTADDGGALEVVLKFERATPRLSPFELTIHSAANPDFYRLYRGEQATDVLRNAASGVDRVTTATVEASGGRLGEILNGAGPVTAISNSPFYARRTFLP